MDTHQRGKISIRSKGRKQDSQEQNKINMAFFTRSLKTYIINCQQKAMLLTEFHKLKQWCKVSIHTKQAGKTRTKSSPCKRIIENAPLISVYTPLIHLCTAKRS